MDLWDGEKREKSPAEVSRDLTSFAAAKSPSIDVYTNHARKFLNHFSRVMQILLKFLTLIMRLSENIRADSSFMEVAAAASDLQILHAASLRFQETSPCRSGRVCAFSLGSPMIPPIKEGRPRPLNNARR